MFLSLAAAGVGFAMATLLSEGWQRLCRAIEAKAPALYTLLYNKWFVDEGYDYVFTDAARLATSVWA